MRPRRTDYIYSHVGKSYKQAMKFLVLLLKERSTTGTPRCYLVMKIFRLEFVWQMPKLIKALCLAFWFGFWPGKNNDVFICSVKRTLTERHNFSVCADIRKSSLSTAFHSILLFIHYEVSRSNKLLLAPKYAGATSRMFNSFHVCRWKHDPAQKSLQWI